MSGDRSALDKRALVGRNAAFLVTACLLSAVMLVVLWAWIARALSPSRFGNYGFAVVTVAYVYGFLTEFGSRYYTTRQVALDKTRMGSFLINGSVAKALVTVVTFVPMLAFIYFVYVPQCGPEILLFSAVACVSMILKQYVIFLTAFYDGLERMHVTAAVGVGQTLLIMGFVGLALRLRTATGMPILLLELAAMVVTSAVVLWLALRLAREFKSSFNWAEVWGFCRGMAPFGLYFLFGILYLRADGFILQKIKGEEATALYFPVVHLLVRFEIIPNLASVALYPTLSREVSQDVERGRKMFGEALRILFTMGLPIVIACSLFANELAVAVFGIEYAGCGPLLMVVAWTLLLNFPGAVANTVLFATNKQAFGAAVAAVFVVVSVGLNLALIPRYSAMGAAVASVVTCWGVVIARYLYARRIVGAPGLPGLWGPPICAGIVMAGIGLLLKTLDMSLVPAVAIEAVAYCAALFLLGGIKPRDVALVKNVLSPSKR